MIQDISIFKLTLGLLILLIPIVLLLYFRIRILKNMLIAVSRMILQLSLVAVYLEWIFKLNNLWINILWVFMMICVGVFTTIRRVRLNWKLFIIPLFIAALTSVIIIDAFFLGAILQLDYCFDAQYFIPITGMILGNSLNHNIIGLTTYFRELNDKNELYTFLLINTNNHKSSLYPFIKESVMQGLNPLIASMSVIGLISLPGMMTGQILGGNSPSMAIKYQIMMMIAIFAGCTINLLLSIVLANRFVFDKFGRLQTNITKKSKSNDLS